MDSDLGVTHITKRITSQPTAAGRSQVRAGVRGVSFFRSNQ